MRIGALILALILLLSGLGAARADEPWIVYGQSTIPYNGSVDNPAANAAGVIGQASLPYTVPPGYFLTIEAWGVEAYATAGLVGMFPWLGPPPATNAKALHTNMANTESHETLGARYRLPPGTIVNIRIMNTENPAQVVGWYISGTLTPIDPPPDPTPCTCP